MKQHHYKCIKLSNDYKLLVQWIRGGDVEMTLLGKHHRNFFAVGSTKAEAFTKLRNGLSEISSIFNDVEERFENSVQV